MFWDQKGRGKNKDKYKLQAPAAGRQVQMGPHIMEPYSVSSPHHPPQKKNLINTYWFFSS